MVRFILKRLLSMIPILLGTSIITFGMLHLVPVDPAEAYLRAANIPVSESAIEAARIELGLNHPLHIQYLNWFNDMMHLDFGKSFISKKPVWDEMMMHFPATLELTVAAIGWVLLFAVPIGILSAIFKDSFFDQLSRLWAYAGVSMPNFWFGFLLIYFCSLKLHLFPAVGSGTWLHLVLPSFTLAFAQIAISARLLRSNMLDQLNQPYVQYARVRGIRGTAIVGKHVLKNALVPVITSLGMSFGHLLAGSVALENVFAWPGIGRYFVSAIFARDYPVIQCYVMLMAAIFILLNLLVDIVNAYLNPRLRVKGD
jgi:nickel transport system permease protein